MPENNLEIKSITPMGMIQLAVQQGADVDKLQKLMDLQKQWEANQAEKAFALAMTEVQAALPRVINDATNPQTRSKYSKLETIHSVIKPIYTQAGFSITFSQADCDKENFIRIIGILRHKQGHSETHHLDLPLDLDGIKGNPNKTITHATGSTYKYGRRYLTCMIFDVTTGDDDDDGNGAGKRIITDEQAADLMSMLDEVKADKAEFCKYFKIDTLEMLPEQAFKMAVTMINAKRKRAC